MWVQPLGQEEPLEEEMATHSSIRVWKIPWTEEPGWLQSMGLQRVGHNACAHAHTHAHTHTHTRSCNVQQLLIAFDKPVWEKAINALGKL